MRKQIIKLALWMLKIAGNGVSSYETPNQVFDRRVKYLQQLIDAGYKVVEKTPYMYRINGVLDIYPKNARWHDLKNGRRGGFEGQNICLFVRKYFKEI